MAGIVPTGVDLAPASDTAEMDELSAAGQGPIPDVSPNEYRPVKRGRFATNIAANVGALVLNMLIGLWFTPYLIHHLGVASYGLIPLVTQIVGWLAVATAALNAAVGRWVTIALERHEWGEASRYFNASLFGSLFLVAVLAVPAGLAVGNAHSLIHVPPGQEAQARWLMGCALAVFLLHALLTPFGVATYSMNRFDLRNLVGMTENVLRVGIVVVLFSLVAPQLRLVGVAMVVAALAYGAVSLRLWRKLTPMLRISFRDFSIRTVGRLVSFGGWVAVEQIGVVLFVPVELLIVNRLFGPTSGGRYAAVMQWSNLLRMLAGTISAVFGPTILYIYARREIDGLALYARRAIKLLGFLVALPIGLICGFSAPLLRTWLGPDFVALAPLMSLMTIYLSVTVVVRPLAAVQAATNHVAVPGIVTLVMGAANLGLALLLAGPLGWGLYGVAAATAITLTARNVIFVPLYAAHCLKRRAVPFYSEIARNVIITALTAAVCYAVSSLVELSGWGRLSIAGALVSAIYLAVGFLASSSEERALLRQVVSVRS